MARYREPVPWGLPMRSARTLGSALAVVAIVCAGVLLLTSADGDAGELADPHALADRAAPRRCARAPSGARVRACVPERLRRSLADPDQRPDPAARRRGDHAAADADRAGGGRQLRPADARDPRWRPNRVAVARAGPQGLRAAGRGCALHAVQRAAGRSCAADQPAVRRAIALAATLARVVGHAARRTDRGGGGRQLQRRCRRRAGRGQSARGARRAPGPCGVRLEQPALRRSPPARRSAAGAPPAARALRRRHPAVDPAQRQPR